MLLCFLFVVCLQKMQYIQQILNNNNNNNIIDNYKLSDIHTHTYIYTHIHHIHIDITTKHFIMNCDSSH